mmetsp:Transcript_26312/g.89958  ORF Transcript_26312/g.89958 Transcript_26312/m.89958 type:complete len:229 (+) Transcript_26312:395-1081(+)
MRFSIGIPGHFVLKPLFAFQKDSSRLLREVRLSSIEACVLHKCNKTSSSCSASDPLPPGLALSSVARNPSLPHTPPTSMTPTYPNFSFTWKRNLHISDTKRSSEGLDENGILPLPINKKEELLSALVQTRVTTSSQPRTKASPEGKITQLNSNPIASINGMTLYEVPFFRTAFCSLLSEFTLSTICRHIPAASGGPSVMCTFHTCLSVVKLWARLNTCVKSSPVIYGT